MNKIPCLFQRDFTDKRHPVLLRTVTPGCEWVLAGEGVATRKWDGTACLVRDGKLYKRYDLKVNPKTGERKTPPPGFEPCGAPDEVTGHHPGWLPVGDEPESRWHREAWQNERDIQGTPKDGTYEMCGPRVGTNPERFDAHMLVRHGMKVLADCPRDFDGIREFLRPLNIEGIVFWHPDGRMVKIRKVDYGLPRDPHVCTHCKQRYAHEFTWTRASDDSERVQTIDDAYFEPLCRECAVALPADEICACQHCQAEHQRLLGQH